jgi:glycosyltransferase involved in cell wall biosynthesis
MVDSVHVYRWLSQFDPTEIKFILFPSTPNRRVHPGITQLINRGRDFDHQITIEPCKGIFSVPLWIVDKFLNNKLRATLLRQILKRESPDFVHALEFQNAGYLTSEALTDSSLKTKFIATNYGSDIYWFSRFPKHEQRIRKLLSRVDFYSAECIRDYELARKYGFKGNEIEVAPNAGGIKSESLESELKLTSDRKRIVIKGYHGWAGRALIALKALYLIKAKLAEYEIHIYSANLIVIFAAKFLKMRTGLKITTYRKKSLTHDEVMKLFAKSRVYIGLSVTDGISTSLLEAMAMGTFPIQTSTSCAAEWIIDGASGFLIHNIDEHEVANKLDSALLDNDLVNTAAITNRQTIKDKANYDKQRLKASSFYQLS